MVPAAVQTNVIVKGRWHGLPDGVSQRGVPFSRHLVHVIQTTKPELQHRIKVAWGRFHQLWPLLSLRVSPLKQRLRLFDASVSKSILRGLESWALTVAERRRLRPVRRSMLRRFATRRRQRDEDWIQWIRR